MSTTTTTIQSHGPLRSGRQLLPTTGSSSQKSKRKKNARSNPDLQLDTVTSSYPLGTTESEAALGSVESMRKQTLEEDSPLNEMSAAQRGQEEDTSAIPEDVDIYPDIRVDHDLGYPNSPVRNSPVRSAAHGSAPEMNENRSNRCEGSLRMGRQKVERVATRRAHSRKDLH
jgi:hypothetical protein